MQEDLDEMVVEEDAGEEINMDDSEETEEHEVDESGNDEEAEGEESEEESEGEDFVSIDGESPPAQEEDTTQAPIWVRDLRQKYREKRDEVKALKAELEKTKAAPVENKVTALPARPKLEDYDYDSEEFDKAIDEWHEKKIEFEQYQSELKREQEKQEQESAVVMQNYEKAKKTLRVKDYDVAEEVVSETLPVALQNVILLAADNPASIVYALGKNKTKLEELARIEDPIKFAKELGKLEGKIKVERRKAPPPPEGKVTGTANASGVDSQLERLRKEAEKSGDFSRVIEYKRKNKRG